jgi:SAM-dependent methyltransferase
MPLIGNLFLFLKVKWFSYREKQQVRRYFPGFLSYENAFRRTYRFSNPFRICKSFLRQKGEEEVDAYGESPLPVMAEIAKQCKITAKDIVFELGCGRGRAAFFLSYITKCQVIGIDWVPVFISRANRIAATTAPRLPVKFLCQDMQRIDFSKATVVYLYGTCLSDEVILQLIQKFEKLPLFAKIISVSYPLSEYSPRFGIVKQFSMIFPWGEGEVFLNVRKERVPCLI